MFLLLVYFSVFAYEVDNFTDRELLKRDSLNILNTKVDDVLEQAAKVSRSEIGARCQVSFLRQEILRWIRPEPFGQIEVWLEITNEIDRSRKGISESVYASVPVTAAPILRTVGIGRSFLLNGHVVGSDKVGHFFMQGLEYFDKVREGKSLNQVLKNDHGEDGIWGMGTSGVKSYADMAANYQGYLFWSQLVDGKNPYFVCQSGKGWVKKRKFDWSEYVNVAWDEGMNCSEMRPEMQVAVDAALKKQGKTCPINPDACLEIQKMENSWAFISPKCIQSIQDRVFVPLQGGH